MTDSETSDTAAESDEDRIYIVFDGDHIRSKSVTDSGQIETFEEGDEIDPTEWELENFPDKFLKLNSDGMLAKEVKAERELTPEEKAAKKHRMGR